jgi:predicted PurR-regulated permease PerM
MNDAANRQWKIETWAIVLATVMITAVFVGMIGQFLIALFLAGLFSAMAAPLYRKLLSLTNDRVGITTVLTLIILFTCVLAPSLGIVYVAAIQAGELTSTIVAAVDNLQTQEGGVVLPDWVPYRDEVEAVSKGAMAKVGELLGGIAGYVVSAASAATRGTASFFLSLFIMTYAMVFFLREETNVFAQLLRYSGLSPDAQEKLSTTTISVSRATLRGTGLIGLIQGTLGGLGFWVAGIDGAAFWGIMIAIASIIPGIGPTLVWVPGVIYLAVNGSIPAAIGLALWSGLVVSTIDNVLRPRLVGRDAEMPDILVLISTLGGLAMFGAVGLIIGPVIAGLFIAIWQLFVDEFGIGPKVEPEF